MCTEGLGCDNDGLKYTAKTIVCNLLRSVHAEKFSPPEENGNQWLYGSRCLGWGKVDTMHCYHGNTERTAVPQSN